MTTERSHAHLLEELRRYESMIASSNDMIALLDDSYTYLAANDAYVKWVGKTKDELLHRTVREVFGDEFFKAALEPRAKRCLAGEEVHFDEWIEFPVGGRRYMDVTYFPYRRAANDSIEGIVVYARNLTLHKRAEEILEFNEELEKRVEERTAELQAAQAELVRKERLAILGRLAGCMAHELRHPLGAVRNAAYFLNMVLDAPGPKVDETLSILNREVVNAERIIQSLLDYAAPKPPAHEEVDLGVLLAALLGALRVPEHVELVNEIPAGQLVVADPRHLEQVFRNLVENAVHAMAGSGRLTVSADATDSGAIAVSVTDTGCGIAAENLERIFEPLFTTKAKGIGLGLALAKLHIEAHEGTLLVESENGQGATFIVTLSAANQSKEA